MCLFDMPNYNPPEPQKPEEAKAPATDPTGDARRRATRIGGPAASTLLTGPSGVENSQLMLGRATLLGQ